jgi:1,4-dihydroxy-2-naphthoate polyprenyltransferase
MPLTQIANTGMADHETCWRLTHKTFHSVPELRADPMKKLLAWLQASRLMSQPYILLPLLFGGGIYVWQTGSGSTQLLVLTFVYSVLLQLFIVFANDYADEAVDRPNTTYNLFSGGSRVLVEGKLSRKELRQGILWTMVLGMMVASVVAVLHGRGALILFLIVSWVLLWAYSYPPIQLSYRGGGEWLQAIGVGVLLPLTGYYFQAGNLLAFPWIVLPFTLFLHLGAALVTTLPDEPSDKTGHKKTFSVRKGVSAVILWIILLYGISFVVLFVWVLVFIRSPWISLLITLPAFFAYIGLCSLRSKPVPGHASMDWFVGLGVATAVFLMAGLSILLWVFPARIVFK